MLWSQVYDPFGNMIISALVAAIPVIVLLGAIGIFEMKAHWAALLGLVTALLVAVAVSGMPGSMAGGVALFRGALWGVAVGWGILQLLFLFPPPPPEGGVFRPPPRTPERPARR